MPPLRATNLLDTIEGARLHSSDAPAGSAGVRI